MTCPENKYRGAEVTAKIHEVKGMNAGSPEATSTEYTRSPPFLVNSNNSINNRLPDELLLLILRNVLQGSPQRNSFNTSALSVCDKWYRLGKPLLWEHISFRGSLYRTYNIFKKYYALGGSQVRSLTVVMGSTLSRFSTELEMIEDLISSDLHELEFLSLNLMNFSRGSPLQIPVDLDSPISKPLSVVLQHLPSTCTSLEIRMDPRVGDGAALADVLFSKLQHLTCLRIECNEHELLRFTDRIDRAESLEEFTFVAAVDERLINISSSADRADDDESAVSGAVRQLHNAYVAGKFPKLKRGLLVSPNIRKRRKNRRGIRKVVGMRVLAQGDVISGKVVYCDMLPLNQKASTEERVWTVFHDVPDAANIMKPAVRETTGYLSDIVNSFESRLGALWQSKPNNIRLPASYLKSEKDCFLGLCDGSVDVTVSDLATEPFGTAGTAIWTVLHNNLGIRPPRLIDVSRSVHDNKA